jgi:hypothetical protein
LTFGGRSAAPSALKQKHVAGHVRFQPVENIRTDSDASEEDHAVLDLRERVETEGPGAGSYPLIETENP